MVDCLLKPVETLGFGLPRILGGDEASRFPWSGDGVPDPR